MTLHDVKEILEAKRNCLNNKTNSLCNNDCDNCELTYLKGTYGEQVEAIEIAISILVESNEYAYEEYDDYCYECGGYGDDYSYDEETGSLISNCDNCPHNSMNIEE